MDGEFLFGLMKTVFWKSWCCSPKTANVLNAAELYTEKRWKWQF